MSYNVIDLIDKGIQLATKKKNVYEKIAEDHLGNLQIKISSSVLIKECEKTIKFYSSLRDNIDKSSIEDIDFFVYDKISFIINEYNQKKYFHSISNSKDLFGLSLHIEKDVLSLLIDIQGRYVQKEEDVNTVTYKIISLLINEKIKYILSLEKLINN